MKYVYNRSLTSAIPVDIFHTSPMSGIRDLKTAKLTSEFGWLTEVCLDEFIKQVDLLLSG